MVLLVVGGMEAKPGPPAEQETTDPSNFNFRMCDCDGVALVFRFQ
jgi:hypothetical protein